MRKLIVILTTCFILFSLIGCQGNSEEKELNSLVWKAKVPMKILIR